MPSKKEQISIPVNQKYVADYLGVARGTVAKAIKQHKIEPIGRERGADTYELKELLRVLQKPAKTVRAGRETFNSNEIKVIDSIYARFETMKEYLAYQQSLVSEQNRKKAAGLLMESESVVATIGATISRVLQFSQKMPNVAQEICPDFTNQQATKFDERIETEMRTLLLDAQGMIDDANERLRAAGDGS